MSVCWKWLFKVIFSLRYCGYDPRKSTKTIYVHSAQPSWKEQHNTRRKKKYWKKKTNQEQHQSHQTSVEHSSIKTSTRISRQYERRQESGIYVHAILFSPTSLWLQLFPFFLLCYKTLNLFFHCFIFSFLFFFNLLECIAFAACF